MLDPTFEVRHRLECSRRVANAPSRNHEQSVELLCPLQGLYRQDGRFQIRKRHLSVPHILRAVMNLREVRVAGDLCELKLEIPLLTREPPRL